MNINKVVIVIMVLLCIVLITINTGTQKRLENRERYIEFVEKYNDELLEENIILKNQIYFKKDASPLWSYREGDVVRNSTEFHKLFNFTFKGTIISFREDGHLLIKTPYMNYAVNEYWTVPVNSSSEGLPSHIDIILPDDAQYLEGVFD